MMFLSLSSSHVVPEQNRWDTQVDHLDTPPALISSIRELRQALLLLLVLYSSELQLYLFYFPGLLYLRCSLLQLPAGYGRGPRAPVSPAHVVPTVCISMSSAGSGRGPRAPVSPARVGATMYSLMSMSVLPPQRLHTGSSSVQRPATMCCLVSTSLLPPRRLH